MKSVLFWALSLCVRPQSREANHHENSQQPDCPVLSFFEDFD